MADQQTQKELNQIVREVHKVIPFFQGHFDKFCRMVEDYGEHVENCSKNPDLYVDINKEKRIEKQREKLREKYHEYVNQEVDIDNQINKENQVIINAIQQIESQKDIAKNNALIKSSKKKIRELNKSYKPIRQRQKKYKKELEALPTDPEPPMNGCIEYTYDAFVYINLPFIYPKQKRNKSHGKFWITPEHVNPTMWFNQIINFTLFPTPQIPTPQISPKNDDEQLICNAVILSAVHDVSQGQDVSDKRVYINQKYQGKYFQRNKFCRDLWEIVKDKEGRIQNAFDIVKPYLDKWLEKLKDKGLLGDEEEAQPSVTKKNIKKTEYNEFLAESRDKIAKRIVVQQIKALFAVDMNEREDAFKRYNAACDAHVKSMKSERKRYDEYLETPAGRAYWEKKQQWDKDYQAYEEHQKKHGPHFGDRLPDKHPGKPPIADFEWKEFNCVNPLAKFDINIHRGTEPLAIKDYRVLLGALHDGFTWNNGDKSQYICPDLCKPDTIVSVLYWKWMMKNAKYQPLIEEAFLYVEKDLRENKRPADSTAAEEQQQRKDLKETPPVGEWSTPMSKAEMMTRLRIDSYKTFNAFAKTQGIEEAGNRQTFIIRLDKMDAKTRSKLEKK